MTRRVWAMLANHVPFSEVRMVSCGFWNAVPQTGCLKMGILSLTGLGGRGWNRGAGRATLPRKAVPGPHVCLHCCPASASTVTWPSLSVYLSPCNDTVIGLRAPSPTHGLILTIYICNNLVSKLGHVHRSQRWGVQNFFSGQQNLTQNKW